MAWQNNTAFLIFLAFFILIHVNGIVLTTASSVRENQPQKCFWNKSAKISADSNTNTHSHAHLCKHTNTHS